MECRASTEQPFPGTKVGPGPGPETGAPVGWGSAWEKNKHTEIVVVRHLTPGCRRVLGSHSVVKFLFRSSKSLSWVPETRWSGSGSDYGLTENDITGTEDRSRQLKNRALCFYTFRNK